MKLRKLALTDAVNMLEWMHDESVVAYMGTDFTSKTIEDCKNFIEASLQDTSSVNLAIADEKDEYLGTVSLKHIDKEHSTAEFAITVRKKAMGTGASSFGMKEILRMGHEELNIDKIYWCVNKENKRAVRFYDKNLFERTENVPAHIKSVYSDEQNKTFYWYVY